MTPDQQKAIVERFAKATEGMLFTWHPEVDDASITKTPRETVKALFLSEIETAVKEDRKEIVEKIKERTKSKKIMKSFQSDKARSYNTALSDIITLIQSKK